MNRCAGFLLLLLSCMTHPAAGLAENSIDSLYQETLSFFKPLRGTVISVEGKQAVLGIREKADAKGGMRLQILREEAPFRHPVTKEPLGKLESLVGKLQLTDVAGEQSRGEIIEGEAKEGDLVRVSEKKISLLFCQSRDTDWQTSEYYYRKLKESGRFQIIDTALETVNPEEVLAEARKLQADIALHLNMKKTDGKSVLLQDLFWVADGQKIKSSEIRIDEQLARELAREEKYFTAEKNQMLTQFDVPASAQMMILCDIDGDGRKELIFSTGTDLIVYALDRDLQPALGGIMIKGSVQDRHIWLDAIDLNQNGKDEIIITLMKGDEVISSLFEYDGKTFVLLFQDNGFMRNIEGKLFAQPYARSTGFDGEVYQILWERNLKRGGALSLPGGVNIYDLIFFDDPKSGTLFLAHDENGYFSVYDSNHQRLWKSATGTGEFLTTFNKISSSVMVERGKWSVKDRLFFRQKQIFYVKRIPFLDIVKGLGYRKSQIRGLQWQGNTMDDRVIIDGVDGTLLDYAVTGDNVYILASPLFGIRAENIIKGDNPVRKYLAVYPLKGM